MSSAAHRAARGTRATRPATESEAPRPPSTGDNRRFFLRVHVPPEERCFRPSAAWSQHHARYLGRRSRCTLSDPIRLDGHALARSSETTFDPRDGRLRGGKTAVVTVGRERFSVIEPLELLHVRRVGSRLWLAVQDRQLRRHFISFRFATRADARSHVDHMLTWIAERTPLAYVQGRGESALVNVQALLARAIA